LAWEETSDKVIDYDDDGGGGGDSLCLWSGRVGMTSRSSLTHVSRATQSLTPQIQQGNAKSSSCRKIGTIRTSHIWSAVVVVIVLSLKRWQRRAGPSSVGGGTKRGLEKHIDPFLKRLIIERCHCHCRCSGWL